MHFWVYLLRCSDGTFYAGHTDNIDKRVAEHKAGYGADYTLRRRPVELAWCECLPSRDEAFAFERRIKGWTRAKKEALVARDWERVRQLAWSSEKIERLASPRREVERHDPQLGNDARPERSAEREVEGRSKLTNQERPSTSLRSAQDERETKDKDNPSARPERSAKRVVGSKRPQGQGRFHAQAEERPSTSLRSAQEGRESRHGTP